MHELAIACNLVTTVEEMAHRLNLTQLKSVHLKLGALAGVVKDALLFSYEIATKDSLLAGTTLEIEEMPVKLFCAKCQTEVLLASLQSFCCPLCATPSNDIRQGKELDITALEVWDEPAYS